MIRPRVLFHLPTLIALFSLSFFIQVAANSLSRSEHIALLKHHPKRLSRARLNSRQTDEDLPAGWSAQGCYTDAAATRTLSAVAMNSATLTHSSCIAFCDNKNYIYAGMEYSQECYCDNYIENGGAPATDGCTMPCSGNATETCGGPNRLTVFKSSKPPPPQPVTVPSYGNWTSLGCYIDNAGGRSLVVPMTLNQATTIERCADACYTSGYGYAGTEYSAECYCGSTLSNGAAPATDGCTMLCAGNSTEYCGGPNRLNLYQYHGDLPPVSPPAGGGGGGGPPPPPVTKGLPVPWHYAGCWVDQQFGRILVDNTLVDDNNRTVEQCVGYCSGKNYTLAGLEYAVQCFCGDEIRYNGTLAANQNDCNMACGGDAAHACGAGNRISLYSTTDNITTIPVPVPKSVGLPGNWNYTGCYAEPNYPAPRTFPKQIIFGQTMTPDTCLNLCAKYGYPAAGMEFGDECYCGDASDVTQNSAGLVPETECNIACTADPAHICGSALRLTVYNWIGNLTVWHTPAVKGQYEFLVGGPVVPLQTSLGLNNKVTFLEKLGSGPQNSTHAYELDYTLSGNIWKAWREMHVKTDVFCSAGVMLPDKAGRQLNIGGWSLDSTFGVRLYTPDGAFGVNGTNDWEEDYSKLALQRGRWYPSAMVMSNGSVLVVGGQIGANDLPSPSLEILPRIPGGDTVLNMDWLNRTNPNNLYPFLHVLPSGGIFVLYYNEARILDPVTFATIKEMPIIPGAVDKIGGRTYPLEGSDVMLPQRAPYTDPVTMLACGGSDNFYALDNCVTIMPEIDNSTWTIERMPFPRVLTCMVGLPDGTYLIVNGARQGTAGFGLAVNPVLTAILYDPTLPIGQRMSILGDTIVPRMYHSEAILLHDARVLVTGSDPIDDRYPEEYRVEVYIPPYLASGLAQPTYTIEHTDWVYSGQYQITATLPHGGPMRVSLIGGGVSTHGNSMGQRTIFPAFTCSGNTCTITAPPNAHICPPGWFQLFILDGPTPSYSQWVRIGGDPGHLGEWPNLPGFTPPGM